MNPIEHVWDMLGRRIASRQPPSTCLPGLRRALLDEFCNDPQDQIDSLMLSMPGRYYFQWSYVKSLVSADKPQTLDHLEDNIRRVIADIRPQMLEKVIKNWTSRLDHIRASHDSHMPEIIFKMSNHWEKLEEGRSVTSVAAELGIAHSIVSRLWRQFQTTGTAIRGFSSGRPRGTTPADDRYIVLQARRNRPQTAGEIARHATQATGRPILRFTVTRRLHGGGLFAVCTCTVCTFNAYPSEKAFSVVPGTPKLERQ
ncbi:transposable element Tc1 transposase [Trichonephila clavipes]|nr:transposable element Tc1 transposase [Trichonephila clavipes]